MVISSAAKGAAYFLHSHSASGIITLVTVSSSPSGLVFQMGEEKRRRKEKRSTRETSGKSGTEAKGWALSR